MCTTQAAIGRAAALAASKAVGKGIAVGAEVGGAAADFAWVGFSLQAHTVEKDSLVEALAREQRRLDAEVRVWPVGVGQLALDANGHSSEVVESRLVHVYDAILAPNPEVALNAWSLGHLAPA